MRMVNSMENLKRGGGHGEDLINSDDDEGGVNIFKQLKDSMLRDGDTYMYGQQEAGRAGGNVSEEEEDNNYSIYN